MVARRQIVELVAEIAVASVRQHLDEHGHSGQNPRNPHSSAGGVFPVGETVFRHILALDGRPSLQQASCRALRGRKARNHPRVVLADPSGPRVVSYTLRGGSARRMPARPNPTYTTGPTARATGPHISP